MYKVIIEKNGDYFEEEFDHKTDAISYADLQYHKFMTDAEKRKCKEFYIENPEGCIISHYIKERRSSCY